MGSRGSLRGEQLAALQSALKRGDLDLSVAYARDLGGRIDLRDAALMLVLLKQADDRRFDAAARRWLERYLAEAKPTVDQVADAAGAIADLPYLTTAETLIGLVAR